MTPQKQTNTLLADYKNLEEWFKHNKKKDCLHGYFRHRECGSMSKSIHCTHISTEQLKLMNSVRRHLGCIAETFSGMKTLLEKYMIEVGNKNVEAETRLTYFGADDFLHLIFPDDSDGPIDVEARVAHMMETHLFVYYGVAEHNSLGRQEEDYGFFFEIINAPDGELEAINYDDVVGSVILPLEWLERNFTEEEPPPPSRSPKIQEGQE